MKYFFLTVGFLLLFPGCSNEKSEPHSSLKDSVNMSAETAQVKNATIGKTFFSFSEKETLFLKPDEKKTVSVQVSPQYEPVTTLQITLIYDPQRIQISALTSMSGIQAIEPLIDQEKGIISFTGTKKEGIFGKDIPVFSFTAEPVSSAPKGETLLHFDMSSVHALLPDVNNTDTAVTENTPVLIFSLL